MSDGCVLVVTVSGEGERVSSSVIEKCGVRKGALVVRVNDRRDIKRKKSSFDEVTFTKPEEIIEEKIDNIGLTSSVSELEEMARDNENYKKSKLKDTAEEVVNEMIESSSDIDEVIQTLRSNEESDNESSEQVGLSEVSD